MGKPQKLGTPTTDSGEMIGSALKESFLPGSSKTGKKILGGDDFGTWVTDTFKLPGYEGELAVGPNKYQTGAADDYYGMTPQLYSNIMSASNSLNDIASKDYMDEIYGKLDASRRLGLARDMNDTREQFSSAGLRNSTAFANAMGLRQSESEAGLQAKMAEIIPQLLQQRTAAASQLPGLTGAAGDIAKNQYSLGEGLRGIEDERVQRQLIEFLRQNGLYEKMLPILLGSKADWGPSVLSQVGNLLAGGGSLAAGITK